MTALINNIDMCLTIISIIVTLFSIVCSIVSWYYAKSAKKYKEQVIHSFDTFELLSIATQFDKESSLFQNHTRKNNWYRGRDISTIISPFVNVLKALGKVYHLFDEEENLENRVTELYRIVSAYDNAQPIERKTCTDLIFEISNILNKATHTNISKVMNKD